MNFKYLVGLLCFFYLCQIQAQEKSSTPDVPLHPQKIDLTYRPKEVGKRKKIFREISSSPQETQSTPQDRLSRYDRYKSPWQNYKAEQTVRDAQMREQSSHAFSDQPDRKNKQ